ncbi:NAD-dependent epimerase/dehydratase family protein [Streptomyces sp. NRRL S-350]|uniref:NAD-dependent epimerase/dehydratase family protein n=1 Tax=Streptomyces sp. NRRL S-350 TaxID=1463902 RepID=UPI0004BF7061|nr:NAD-dependent epimerase/dehydratase family protein [Streptomyces sp. NRRL S-350]
MENVLVIGGNRYFGRQLVTRLRDSGVRVSVLNRGSAPPPPGVTRLVADRADETALTTALAGRDFDAVVDQVCYTPRQAALAVRAFAGRTGRYLMTSTIEVYDTGGAPACERVAGETAAGETAAIETAVGEGTAGEPRPTGRPLAESAVDPSRWPVRLELPWEDAAFTEVSYGEGKRQAEAVFTRAAAFPFTSVRLGHVLGAADFTGRLAHYAERIAAGQPVLVHPENRPSSYTHEAEAAAFLAWAAGEEFTGPVNLASHGELTATDLCELIAAGRPYRTAAPEPGQQASPFSFDRYYGMDNSRAQQLGHPLTHTLDWLPGLIAASRGQELPA